MYYLSLFSDLQDRHSFEGFNMPPLGDDILHEQEDEEDDEDNYDRVTVEQSPIPPSFIQDEIFVPNALPVPATSTPVLPPPNRKEKQRRITNQDVLKLQAEVLQHHKEVLILKKENIRLKNQALREAHSLRLKP
jgi:hypothetical protein